MKTEVSIITVTYNSSKFIHRYLNSVANYLSSDRELVLVDSGSPDQTVSIIKQFLVQHQDVRIKLIESQDNIGYGKGGNLAAKKSHGRLLFFLNPDTEILADVITSLADYLANHPQVGLIAPQLKQFDGQIQPTVRRFPTIWGAIKQYYLGIKNTYQAYVPGASEPVAVESVVGAAMMIRRDVYLRVGGFDEKFFLYFEDIDLCKKVYQLGYQIVYLPGTGIKHLVGGTQTYPEKNLRWLNQSASLYHGFLKGLILKILLRLRPIK